MYRAEHTSTGNPRFDWIIKEFEQLGDSIWQVKSHQVKSGQVKSGEVKSGQVRSVQVKSGHVKSGHVKSGQVESGQVKSGQLKTCLLCFYIFHIHITPCQRETQKNSLV